jgi:membrane dipeptidase
MYDRVITRTRFLKLLAACGVGAGVAPLLSALEASEPVAETDVASLVQDSLVVDGQFVPRNPGGNTWPTSPNAVKRLLGVDAGFWDIEDVENLVEVDKLVEHYGNAVMRVDNADDLGLARASGRLGLIYYTSRHWKLDGSVEPLARWRQGGLRAIQLAHEGDNGIGGGFDRDELRLTAFGKQVVNEVNRLGMLIDVSHCGRRTTLDVAGASSRPVVACRANAAKLTPHDKNKSDKEIKAIATTGGVVAITNRSRFLRRGEGSEAGLADFVAHVDHVVEGVGIDHVGLASDTWMNGMPRYPYDRTDSNLNVPKRWVNVARALRQKGYSDDDLRKVLGLNLLRVIRASIG